MEKWLPLHAACINGHTNMLELLINYDYPDHLYSTYRDEEGIWEWRLPFDPNQQDVTGQTSLYIASILGNKSLVNTLLNWKLNARKTSTDGSQSTPITPTRKRISFGIQAIMSKLNISSEGDHLIKVSKILLVGIFIDKFFLKGKYRLCKMSNQLKFTLWGGT